MNLKLNKPIFFFGMDIFVFKKDLVKQSDVEFRAQILRSSKTTLLPIGINGFLIFNND
jgi:hypothetical protein